MKMTQKAKLDRAREFITRRFPKVDFKKLGPITFGKRSGNENDIVSLGPRGGETKIFKQDGKDLLKSFTDEFRNALGPKAEDVAPITGERQRLREAEKQLKESERNAVELQRTKDDLRHLRNRIEQTQARVDALEEEQGSNLESESELQRLKQLKKNLQADLENKETELGALQTLEKHKNREQARVDKLRRTFASKEKERNAVEERLNSTKTAYTAKRRR